MNRVNVMRPGMLVSLHTAVRGGVAYNRVDLAAPNMGEAAVSRWETTRVINDPAEFERANNVRASARSMVAAVCFPCPAGGLLCPNDKEQELLETLERARAMCDKFNASTVGSRVEISAWIGRIARDDAEAVRAMTMEMGALLRTMQEGIKSADVEAIREAANKARALGGMLSDDVAGKVDAAIAEARQAARAIVKRVEKAGEQAADVVKDLAVSALETARFSFLDMDEGTVSAVEPSGRGIDIPAESVQEETSAHRLPFALEV